MKASQTLLNILKKLLPSPFTLAVVLSILAVLLSAGKIGYDIFQDPALKGSVALFSLPDAVAKHWYTGFSGAGLLAFALQMMLMLVLGHVLALTRQVKWIVNRTLPLIKGTASAALVVTGLTVMMGLFNWGLALIFGAILARKVGEYAAEHRIPLNYGLVGAAGYSGLVVWHGGLSGSAPLKVAESGHQFMDLCGVVGMDQTVFSPMNLTVSLALIFLLPLGMWFLGKRSEGSVPVLIRQEPNIEPVTESDEGEKLERMGVFSKLFGSLILLVSAWLAMGAPLLEGQSLSLNFLNPNYINFALLGLCLVLHNHLKDFLQAVDQAIKGASGILIQFPLYGGIMGLLSGSGMIQLVSQGFVEISTVTTFPLFTLVSAGIVNFFVPSGGGQWMVQGPIVLEASTQLGVPHWKGIMALSYGDQLTNMMQPFWALPLLGITGLKAKDILPYSLFLMLLAGIIFVAGLLAF